MKRGAGSEEEWDTKRQRTKPHAAEPPPKTPIADYIGRSCCIRKPGETEWVSGTLLAFRGVDKKHVELQLDSDAPEMQRKPARLNLATHAVYVASDSVWAPADEDADAPACGAEGFADGLVPALCLERISDPTPEDPEPPTTTTTVAATTVAAAATAAAATATAATAAAATAAAATAAAAPNFAATAAAASLADHVFVHLLGTKKFRWVPRAALRHLARHMLRRRIPPQLKKAVQLAMDEFKSLGAATIRSLKGSIIGKKVCIYWPDDEAWYTALVLDHLAKEQKHRVRYELDGVEEDEALEEQAVYIFDGQEEEAEFSRYAADGLCYVCRKQGVLCVVPPGAMVATTCGECGDEAAIAAAAAAATESAADKADGAPAAPASIVEVENDTNGANGASFGSVASFGTSSMLQCHSCHDRFHLSCLDKPLEYHPELWGSWRCLSCKVSLSTHFPHMPHPSFPKYLRILSLNFTTRCAPCAMATAPRVGWRSVTSVTRDTTSAASSRRSRRSPRAPSSAPRA